MEILYIAATLIMAYILIQFIVLPKIRYNNLYNTLKVLVNNNNFTIEVCKKKPYSFKISTATVNLYISFINIPKNSIVTINSSKTWRLSWGGSPSKPGRSYPNNRYLSEIVNFLVTKIDDPKAQKVVILYKRTENVLMYVNESELELVSSKDSPHGIKVIQFVDLKKDFLDLIN